MRHKFEEMVVCPRDVNKGRSQSLLHSIVHLSRNTQNNQINNAEENMIMYVSKLTEQVSGWGARVRSCSTLSSFNPFYPQATPTPTTMLVHAVLSRGSVSSVWIQGVRMCGWNGSFPPRPPPPLTSLKHHIAELSLQKKLPFVAFWLMVQTMSHLALSNQARQ